MIDILAMFGIGLVGSIVWVLNPEVSSVVYGDRGWHPLLVGLLIGSGQIATYTGLYFGGEALAARWRWLHDNIERTRTRYQRHLEGGYLTVMLFSAIIGIPPPLIVAGLAGGFGIRWSHVMPVALLGRVIRLATLAALGESLLDWFRVDVLGWLGLS
ncbi:MAG: hypothetical protein H6746_18415 [Deltaproteobacteria bacterium]|nr:hypothetical protein [Deltaproteobacteria bacterium]